jgi:hypothetical protein
MFQAISWERWEVNGSPEREKHGYLQAVADAQHGHAEIKDGGVGMRRIFVVDGIGGP